MANNTSDGFDFTTLLAVLFIGLKLACIVGLLFLLKTLIVRN